MPRPPSAGGPSAALISIIGSPACMGDPVGMTRIMRTYSVSASLILLALASGCKGNARPIPQEETASCVLCHGGYDEAAPYRIGLALAAPPRSTVGTTETSDARVGAHRQHLVDGSIRTAIECSECHVVPTQVAGHFGDASGRATVPVDGPLATNTGALVPTYDFSTTTCTNTYCHGATLQGGNAKSPVWNVVNGSQKSCGSCHGFPPLPSHSSYPNNMNCSSCHPGTVLPSGEIDVAGGLHIDGTVQGPSSGCTSCHGGVDESPPNRTGLALAAPPLSTIGTTATSDARVGAHRQHLLDGTIRAAIQCSECHVVPTQLADHNPGPSGRATVPIGGPLATKNGTLVPAYDFPSATCTNAYCHGTTLGGGNAKSPVWNVVNGSQKTCGSCHGFPPPSHSSYPNNTTCNGCHPGTVLVTGAIDIAGGLHIDGTVQGPSGGSDCTLCHAFPKADAIHAVHTNPPTTTGTYGELRSGEGATANSYYFGCGECHPLDEGSHHPAGSSLTDNTYDVVLTPPATPVPGDELKRRNDPAAAYDDASGTCSGVYCHSSGQETPVYVTTPNWRSPPAGGIGCNGCHGNPPSYLSGPAASATANSHLFLDSLNWENGHFAGLPGTGHGANRHGGGEYALGGVGYGANQVASPITCQACHYDTVDPANVLAGRFFYFDTSGTYELPGGDTTRQANAEWQSSQCGRCHDGSLAPAGVGRVLPAKHVNGFRDVAFDARPTYTGAQTGVPPLADPSTLRPYYVTVDPTNLPAGLHPDMHVLTSTSSTSPAVLTFNLANAAYNPATKTCSNVACHLERQAMVAAGQNPPGPLVWGQQDADYWVATGSGCGGCHSY